MEVKAGYKKTEVGMIPEDWDVLSLRQVCRMKSGESITGADIDVFSKYPCYGGNGLRGFTSRFTHDGQYALIGRQGALCGNVVGVEGKFFASEHAVVVTPFEQTDIHWLTYVLGDMRLNQYSESSAQPGLSVSKLLKLNIAFPPSKTEQHAIAAALSDVDSLLTALHALIAKKRFIKQGTMQELLTGKRRLPGFTNKWEEFTLSGIGKFFKGRGIKKDETVREGLPCVRYGEIYTHHNDYIKKFFSFITPKTAAVSQRIKRGDLLFTGSGETAEGIGKCVAFLGEEEAYAGGDIIIVTPAGHNSLYLGYLMNHSSIVAQKSRMAQGDAIVHIGSEKLGQISFHLPSIKEQTAIAEILSDMDDEIASLETRREKTSLLKQGIMQELLTGKIRLV